MVATSLSLCTTVYSVCYDMQYLLYNLGLNLHLHNPFYSTSHKNITDYAVAPARVNRDWLCQWETAIFDPHRIDTAQQITKKFVTGDYVSDPYGCAKLGVYLSTRGFWAYGWNITKIIFIYAPFLGTHLQTRRRIFTHDCSNDADSRRDVPFWGLFHIAPHLGVNNPKTLILGRE